MVIFSLVVLFSSLFVFEGQILAAKGKGPQILLHRKVDHTKAYEKRPELGQHVAIKITPPELRGKPGVVLVEVYNWTTKFISVMDFWVIMTGENDGRYEMRISVQDLRKNWGDITEVKIPGGKLPKIDAFQLKNMQIYDEKARRIVVPVLTDLIKK
jgi:hypothetical protein